MLKNNLIVISGPTATGKTAISIELAQLISGEIVNFDSLLFYKELLIGNARPTSSEMSGVEHHLVADHTISSPINAADFMKKAIEVINSIHSKGKIPILVGGSGFYLQAVLNGMYDSPSTDKTILDRSDELYLNKGIKPFRDFLETHDKESFNQYHENDHYRNRRAVEHFWMTKTKFSESRKEMNKRLEKSPTEQNKWRIAHFHLDLPKDEHFPIILNRTQKMIESGLINEVKDLLKQGFTGEEKPLKSIGYKETFDFINGQFETMDDFSQRLSINTRRLAKSQRTWFKKVDKLTYNPLTQKDKLISDCIKFLKDEN